MATLISVILPTYGRFEQLDEAIESFLRQDYPEKELIIINDMPNAKILCDIENVFVVNKEYRFDSLGEKQNFGAGMCSGDYFVIFNDDDIVLPWGLSYVFNAIAYRKMCLEPKGYFVISDGIIRSYEKGVIGTSGIIHRDAFWKVDGCPPTSTEVDVKMRDRLHKEKLLIHERIPFDKTFFLLGRDSGSVHLMNFPKHHRWQGVKRHMDKAYDKPIEYRVFPHWEHDYVKLCKDYVDGHNPRNMG